MSHSVESTPANYQPFELGAPTTILFAHAHPDDESVATGAAIELFVRQRHTVHIAIATDGLRSTKGDPLFVAGGGRRSECQAVCGEVLGVPPEHQAYFGLPDGELSRASNQWHLTSRLVMYMLRRHIHTVITPGVEGFDGHPDHIALHHAALLASAVARLRGQPVRVWALQPEDSGAVCVPVNYEHKQRALNHYASQFSDNPKTRAAQLAAYHHLMHECETYSPAPLWQLFVNRRAKPALPRHK